MNKNIFREYDLRGIYPSDINEQTSLTIGQSFASYTNGELVIIGHDNRLSSPSLAQYLIKGLLEYGASVIDLGLCTTPMYYAIKKMLGIKNGIMITASHNPKEYNGFKISFSHIGNAFGKTIEEFRDYTLKRNFIKTKPGTYQKFNDTELIYLELIKKGIKLGNRKINVVVDPGNGTSSIIIKKALELFDINYKLINEISDGNFPNHHPDPCVPENMVELGNLVKSLGYDLGIGIDGDGDRVGIVDENGILIPIDKILIIMYKYMFPTLKKKQAIMDVKCSKAVIDEMQKIGLPLEVYRTGASYQNNRINELNLDFGGEFSGHLWFTDRWLGFDDGIYSGLRIIEMLSNINESLSTLTKQIPHYFNTPEIKLEVKEEHKDIIIQKVKAYCNQKGIKYNDIDGVRIDYGDGFALIRKSNTGPNLTLRFEKKSENELELIKNEFIELIKKISLELN